MPCYSPLKGYKDPSNGGWTARKVSGEKMEVACGQCLGCRLDRSRMWAMRITHECSLPENIDRSWFLTLTYDQLNIPDDWSLKKSDHQKFLKRLRKKFGKVRYYLVGEYGNYCAHGNVKDCQVCDVGRPHYHAIVFGLDIPDLVVHGTSKDLPIYTSKAISDVWQMGHVIIGYATFESAAYCARYVTKKLNGPAREDWYNVCTPDGEQIKVLPEYSAMSLKPGIGVGWLEKYKNDVFPSDEVPVPGKGVFKKVPRYYDELYGRESPEKLEEIKARRKAWQAKHGKSSFELESAYKVKKAQIKSLTRKV